ncbi:unnamed protein product [Eruca vesicaria subsp. sativa]|uniref:F-box domain-containing protein n=1 Tax=Eruca vesicaria subsp. sativa TaxID=29727 RepID=A0ABC8IVD4_ERUVS|nr:unnamed protein product [Eruca vesicaria subsp. sativa]
MTSAEVEPTKEKKTVPEPFSSLPDELTENILARVSRWKYASLSLVSKRFHSLLSSKEIYRTRSQIGAEETCVYVWLMLPDNPCARWFSLRTKPNKKQTKRRSKIRFKRGSSGLSVVPIPSSSTDSFPKQDNITTFGPDIYLIGGSYKKPSSSVHIFDCWSHTWRDGPNMTVARKHARTVLLDEKIYVMGGCDIDKYNANWVEVFDIKSQSWSALPGPDADEEELRNYLRKNSDYCTINLFKGKLYLVADEEEFSYEPKNGKWKLVRETSSLISDSIEVSCEMGNVIYGCTDSGNLMWSASEIEGRDWREIKGLEKLREPPTRGLKNWSDFGLVGCGGQLLVMWDTYCSSYNGYNKIWCAKISLESRRNGREVWGKVECVDVLTFPVERYESFDCVAVSV